MKNSQKFQAHSKKPMEIYFFIDPFCQECWSISPIIKRLEMEYGEYFSLKYILVGQLSSLNKKCYDNVSIVNSNKDQAPHLAAISVKAAELQGKKAGIRFIRRLQELMFIEDKDISDINILQQCAKSVGLDLDEFIRDIYSSSAASAFQCDLTISREMEVNEIPSLVFFNENIEDAGIKVTGLYSYDIYVQILKEMFDGYPKPAEKPPLELFLANYPITTVESLAVIYDLPVQQIETMLKKLQLQQKVEKFHSCHGTFYKYKYTAI